MPRIIAMIPTYNEAENIWGLMDAVLALGPEYEALVVDDHSPDGTWRIVEQRAREEPRIHLLHRMRKRGRGLAGIAGFREALRLGADLVVEMDADWSHDPRWIPPMVEAAAHADIVVGSRLVPGGGESGRSATRRAITRLANAYISAVLRLPVRDATSGFRVFRRRCLEALPWEAMRATGPEVVQEVLLAAHSRGFKIAEVPIMFVDRRAGNSTFDHRIMARSLAAIVRLRLRPGSIVQRRTLPRTRLTPLPAALTLPFSWIYGAARAAARGARVAGPFPRLRLPVPVVCVGNLTVGGTGKTPFVQALATLLRDRGWRPAIVSRGYRAGDRLEKPLVVSDGHTILAETERAGDEPRWLAERCPGIPVVVHPNRHAAGEVAIRALGANLVVLDDGFQHDRLRRDLDLVLWDACDIPSAMRLIPTGRLRERLGALRRADAIILTHAEYLPPRRRRRQVDRVIRQLKAHAPAAPILEAETRIAGWERISGRSPLAAGPGGEWHDFPWRGRRVIAISGLARPEGFESMLRETDAIVMRHFAYPDHHAYQADEVDRWRDAMAQMAAELILTTTKDAVKIQNLPMFGLTVLAVQIAMTISDIERWNAVLSEKLPAPPAGGVGSSAG